MAGGQGFTSSAGSIASLAVTVALSGAVITSAQGSVNPNVDGNVALTGQASTVSAGTVSPGWPQALTGSEVTSNSGTLTLTIRPTDPVGQAITTSAGTVTASGSGASAHLSGQEITSDLGIVDSGGQAISGQAITSGATGPTYSLDVPLSGLASTCGIGTVVPQQEAVDSLIESGIGNALPAMSIALTGSGMTGSQGAVSITGDASFALTGIESTVSSGSVGIEESYPISGESITSAQYNVGAPGGATLTGLEVSVIAGAVFTDNDRTYAITGQSITVQDGATFASSLAFVSGQELVSSLQGIGPREVALVGQEIDVIDGIVATEERGLKPVGKPKKTKKKNVLEIDGKLIPINSEEEIDHIIELLKETAKETAALAIERAQNAEKRPLRKILADAKKTLKVPTVRAGENIYEQVSQAVEEIREQYVDTLKTIEILALIRKREEDEEEALLISML